MVVEFDHLLVALVNHIRNGFIESRQYALDFDHLLEKALGRRINKDWYARIREVKRNGLGSIRVVRRDETWGVIGGFLEQKREGRAHAGSRECCGRRRVVFQLPQSATWIAKVGLRTVRDGKIDRTVLGQPPTKAD